MSRLFVKTMAKGSNFVPNQNINSEALSFSSNTNISHLFGGLLFQQRHVLTPYSTFSPKCTYPNIKSDK